MSRFNYSYIIEKNIKIENPISNNIPNIKDTKENKNQEILNKLEFRNKISYLLIAFTFGLSSVIDLAIQFFFKDVLQVQPADVSKLISIYMIPWLIKLIFGLLTDTFPIYGYRRKFYIIICGVLDCFSLILISFIKQSTFLFVSCLFIHNSCLSFLTVLGEAIVVELSHIKNNELENKNIKEKSSKAKNYVSYFFFCKNIGVLISSFFKGVLLKYLKFSTIFIIASFVPLTFIISGVILVEEKINYRNQNDIKSECPKKFKESDPINSNDCTKVTENGLITENKKICKGKFCLFLFQKRIFIPILYIIFLTSMPRYNDQMFYFYSGTLHLDSVDLGIISILTNLAMLGSILFYRFFLKKKSFRKIVTWSVTIGFILSFLSYVLVTRYNIKLGISDFPFVVLSSCLFTIITEFIMLPFISLAAILSPQNYEGTTFAIFLSSINLGIIISNLNASFLTNLLNITTKDLSNLPKLILISNFLALLPLPFLCCIKKTYFEPSHNEDQYSSEIDELKDKKEFETKSMNEI